MYVICFTDGYERHERNYSVAEKSLAIEHAKTLALRYGEVLLKSYGVEFIIQRYRKWGKGVRKVA